MASAGFAAWSAYEARKARKAAEDSATSSSKAAAAAERSADADEKAYELAFKQHQEAQPPKIAWRAHQVNKNRYRLVNEGTDDVYGVAVDEGNLGPAREVPNGVTVRGNGGYVEFVIFATAQTRVPTEILVSWDGHPVPEQVPLQRW